MSTIRPHYGLELVVEVVGNGPGHAAQAFSILKLPVQCLQFFPLRLRLAAISDDIKFLSPPV